MLPIMGRGRTQGLVLLGVLRIGIGSSFVVLGGAAAARVSGAEGLCDGRFGIDRLCISCHVPPPPQHTHPGGSIGVDSREEQQHGWRQHQRQLRRVRRRVLLRLPRPCRSQDERGDRRQARLLLLVRRPAAHAPRPVCGRHQGGLIGIRSQAKWVPLSSVPWSAGRKNRAARGKSNIKTVAMAAMYIAGFPRCCWRWLFALALSITYHLLLVSTVVTSRLWCRCLRCWRRRRRRRRPCGKTSIGGRSRLG